MFSFGFWVLIEMGIASNMDPWTIPLFTYCSLDNRLFLEFLREYLNLWKNVTFKKFHTNLVLIWNIRIICLYAVELCEEQGEINIW